jgi:hypothetical protein
MKSRRTADKSAFRKPTRKSDLANMVTAMKCRRWHWYIESRGGLLGQIAMMEQAHQLRIIASKAE